MRPLATTSDYTALYGAIDAEDTTRVDTLLGYASALVRDAAAGSTAEWLAEDADDVPHGVRLVVLGAVHRVLVTPVGVAQERLGAYSITYRADASTTLGLDGAEVRAIRKAAGLRSASSIDLASPYFGDGS